MEQISSNTAPLIVQNNNNTEQSSLQPSSSAGLEAIFNLLDIQDEPEKQTSSPIISNSTDLLAIPPLSNNAEVISGEHFIEWIR